MCTALDEKAFQESLPKELRHAIFFSAIDMEDLASKCNALIGRVYEDSEIGEGFYICGINQVITREVTESHMSFEEPVVVIHAIVLPEFEEIAVS
jgi:hypothetical protein